MVMGTVGYMSPEQVGGRLADHRSDIFSLGCVLYEMAAGQRAFRRETAAETMTAILREDPPELPRDTGVRAGGVREHGAALPRETPRGALPVGARPGVRAALAAGFVIVGRNRHVGHRCVPPPPSRGRRALALAAMVVGALVIGAIAFALGGRYAVSPAPGGWAASGVVRAGHRSAGHRDQPSLSPDGKTFVYAKSDGANSDLYLLRVGGRNPVNLTPDSPTDDRQPAFSPDGERIAFRSDRDGGGVFLMSASGESVTRLTDFGYTPAGRLKAPGSWSRPITFCLSERSSGRDHGTVGG